ncbi:hypothetical protein YASMINEVIRUS_1510 [Yasminevirus sp. GU-2018]|uniref:Uncharacterized protein n=1 Tax=Yasminevirus sp. GU-2018 TaxID=2420051 RepID=A0A5K0UAD2_9VIRU|nr:hypothetical protein YASMINEVIRUS_1510 [Yasminevirus sp. GU-2018]
MSSTLDILLADTKRSETKTDASVQSSADTQVDTRTDTKNITVSLTTANKYMTRLKTHQSSENKVEDPYGYSRRREKATPTTPANVNIARILTKYGQMKQENSDLDSRDFSMMKSEIQTTVESVKASVEVRRRVSWDITQIKNVIFRTNGLVGIDTILSKLDHLNSIKKEISESLKKLTESCKTDVDLNSMLLAQIKTDDPERSVDVWDKTSLQESIKAINRRINQLESERDKLNATTLVTIELSPASIDILGI